MAEAMRRRPGGEHEDRGFLCSVQGYRWLPSLLPLLLFVLLLPFQLGAQESPAGFDAVAAAATSAREQNDPSRAIDLYRQAVQLNPKWPDGWWFLGLLEYGLDWYAEARDALTHYVDLTPNAGPALALRGLCEFETGEYAQSLTDIEHGLALGAANQPRNAQILYYHDALLLAHAGRFEGALEVYAKLAHDEQPNPELLTSIGLAGLRNAALPKEIIAANQTDPYLAAGNAAFLFMSGHESEAQAAFQDLFQRFPTAANAHLLYGYLLFAKDPDLAILEFKHELEITPANGTAHALLAWAYLLGDNPGGALPHAEKAVEEEPAVATAQLVLGKSQVDTGDVKGGTAHLEQALKLEPDNLEIHLALAKAYSKAGRKEDSVRERRECLLRSGGGEAAQVARP